MEHREIKIKYARGHTGYFVTDGKFTKHIKYINPNVVIPIKCAFDQKTYCNPYCAACNIVSKPDTSEDGGFFPDKGGDIVHCFRGESFVVGKIKT